MAHAQNEDVAVPSVQCWNQTRSGFQLFEELRKKNEKNKKNSFKRGKVDFLPPDCKKNDTSEDPCLFLWLVSSFVFMCSIWGTFKMFLKIDTNTR